MSPSGQGTRGKAHSARHREAKKQKCQNPLINSCDEDTEVSRFLDSLGEIARSVCRHVSRAVPSMVFNEKVLLHFSDKRVNAVVCKSEESKESKKYADSLLAAVQREQRREEDGQKKYGNLDNVVFFGVTLRDGGYTITVKRNALQQP